MRWTVFLDDVMIACVGSRETAEAVQRLLGPSAEQFPFVQLGVRDAELFLISDCAHQ